ncbi:SMI1/KNR4 family protein [Algicola sagamiensis]|uniref:SMI1/KNR4 family protein n=1 Tax=Algicola sagamiensis TaxID=163869 RepID=UPI0003696476|nr:SMI1/KNR4 family protein [Algicola sagamiensis]
MNEIDDLISQAKDKKNYRYREGGTPDCEILDVEKVLNVQLPMDYKYFLSKYGYILWFGEYVVGTSDPEDLFAEDVDVIRRTQYYRAFYDEDQRYQSVPENGVVVSPYDGGGYYLLYTEGTENAGKVGLFLTENWGKEVQRFHSFADFVSFLLNGTPQPEGLPYWK